MRKIIPLFLFLGVGAVLAQNGPLTNLANIPIRTDSNGYVIAAAQTYTGPDGPRRVLANTLGRTDANGYLIITNPTGFGSPLDAQYWVGAANATLTAEKNLGALATALVINTAGVPSAYAGVTCTNQFLRILSAVGAGTCASVSLTADVTGTLGVGNGGSGTATAFTAGSVVFAGASGVYSQDNANLFWDDLNNRLGVNTASPASDLDVNGLTTLRGHLEWFTDNTWNIGTATDFRPKNIWATSTIRSAINIIGDSGESNFLKVRLTGTAASGANQAYLSFTNAFDFLSTGVDGKLIIARYSDDLIGVGLDVSAIDALLKIRTRAHTGDASIHVLNLLLGATAAGAGSNYTMFVDGTAPSSLASNTAGLYADDVAGTVKMHGIHEDGIAGVLGLVQTKTDTGDPTGSEGLFVINTFDNTFKVYADGAWRTLASGW